mmetsp:Transcript_10988/g.17913  ORF Transcript_10988/g.17913 Transcript_10988/m.17913 type:complete len:339 (-) Transcript_10988:157-1173(-)
MESKKAHPYLRAKIQIGNVKGPVSYNLGQTVFHHDDIPESKRVRRNEIKAWTKSKTLSVEDPPWNKSSKPLKPVIIRRQAENYAQDRSKAYQYNYRSETLDYLRVVEPIDRPTKFHMSAQLETRALEINRIKSTNAVQSGRFTRTGEMPVHPNLEGKAPWNVSTEVNIKQKDLRLGAITDKAKEFTGKVNSKSSTFKSKPYVGPMNSVIELQNTIRKQKAEGNFSVAKPVYRPTSAPIDRNVMKNRIPNEVPNKFVTHEHSGVYETNRIDGKSMWSDTGNYAYESKGDIVKVKNLDAFNFEGPSMSQLSKSSEQLRAKQKGSIAGTTSIATAESSSLI